MTLEKLKAEHPDLYKAVYEAGVASVDTDALRAEGVKAETDRVKDVLAQSLPGFEALVQEMALDGKSTGGDVAKAINAKSKEQMTAHRKDIKDDAEAIDVVEAATAGIEDGAEDMSAKPPEAQAAAIWDKDPKVRAEFHDNKESFVAYFKANKDGRVKMLKNKEDK